jgi:hypothetical protein
MVKATVATAATAKVQIPMIEIFGDKQTFSQMLTNRLGVVSSMPENKSLFWNARDIAHMLVSQYGKTNITKDQYMSVVNYTSTYLSVQAAKGTADGVRRTSVSIDSQMDEHYKHGIKGRKGVGYRVGLGTVSKGIDSQSFAEDKQAGQQLALAQKGNKIEQVMPVLRQMNFHQLNELMLEVATLQHDKHNETQLELSKTRESLSEITGAVTKAQANFK